jgi:hypothetical protein
LTSTGAAAQLHETELDSRTHLVRLTGDASGVARGLRPVVATAAAAGRVTIIVDLSEATGVDGPVAWELARAHARLQWRGGQLVTVGDPARLTPLFDAYALHSAPEVVPDFAAARDAANLGAAAEPEPVASPESGSADGVPRFAWQRHSKEPAWSFELSGGAGAPRVARAAVDRLLRPRLDESAKESASLMVSEAVTNSVLHGGADAGSPVELKVSVTPADVRVEVFDPVGGFDPPPYPTDPLSEHGRGLPLIHSLARAWGVGPPPHGYLWFELSRKATRAETPLREPPGQVARTRMVRAAGRPGA